MVSSAYYLILGGGSARMALETEARESISEFC
jgi:hypothetical protein